MSRSLMDSILHVNNSILAGAIRSIQRGTVSAATGGTNVTIAPVTTAKTVVNVASGRAVNDTVVLSNSTTIRVTTSTAGNVNWQVVEYR